MEFKGVKITWLGHDGFIITNGKTVVVDPFKLERTPVRKADILLITHEHFDHFSPDDIKRVATNKTIAVAPIICKPELSRLKVGEIKIARPGDKIKVDNVSIEAVPAYNLNKYREPGKVFHPKEDQKLGYVLEMNGTRVYHAGDTDNIPEMKRIKTDVALLPVSGTYVMTPEEASEAARQVKPSIAVPMHYGKIVGSEKDALKFKQLAPCDVRILEPE